VSLLSVSRVVEHTHTHTPFLTSLRSHTPFISAHTLSLSLYVLHTHTLSLSLRLAHKHTYMHTHIYVYIRSVRLLSLSLSLFVSLSLDLVRLQVEPRKNWEVLVQAYVQAFANSVDIDRVQLYLRAQPFMRWGAGTIRALLGRLSLQGYPLPEVHIQEVALHEEQLAICYQQADAFVLPTHGEGWGRPIMVGESVRLRVCVCVCGLVFSRVCVCVCVCILWFVYSVIRSSSFFFFGSSSSWFFFFFFFFVSRFYLFVFFLIPSLVHLSLSLSLSLS
jgi:hypothetical protein